MTSSTLYRQGDDLDTLLGELSDEHGNRVRIVAVDEERPPGPRGFLARRRVSVQYRLDLDDEPATAESGDPLADLIAQADAAETGASSGPRAGIPARTPSTAPAGRPARAASPAPAGIPARASSPAPARVVAPVAAVPTATPAANAEFASMLLELAAKKAAERVATTSAPKAPATPNVRSASKASAPLSAPKAPAPWSAPSVSAPLSAPKVSAPLSGPSPTRAPNPLSSLPALTAPSPSGRPTPASRPSPAKRPTPAKRPSPANRPNPRPAELAHPAAAAPIVAPTAEPAEPVPTNLPAAFGRPAPVVLPAFDRPAAVERPATFVAAPPPPPIAGSDAALVLRRQLADIGVPVHLLPSASVDPVAAVTNIVAALPEMPRLPAGRHTILALVGPSADLVLAARRLAPDLGVPADRVWIAGLPADALPAAFDLEDASEAATAARWARADSGDLIVALIATDVPRTTNRNQQPAGIIEALEPDAVWAVVDATRKPADTRRRLADVSAATGAIVIQAAETASPASVLELGLPVAMLDGQPATRRRWITALLAALAALAAQES